MANLDNDNEPFVAYFVYGDITCVFVPDITQIHHVEQLAKGIYYDVDGINEEGLAAQRIASQLVLPSTCTEESVSPREIATSAGCLLNAIEELQNNYDSSQLTEVQLISELPKVPIVPNTPYNIKLINVNGHDYIICMPALKYYEKTLNSVIQQMSKTPKEYIDIIYDVIDDGPFKVLGDKSQAEVIADLEKLINMIRTTERRRGQQ